MHHALKCTSLFDHTLNMKLHILKDEFSIKTPERYIELELVSGRFCSKKVVVVNAFDEITKRKVQIRSCTRMFRDSI